MLQATNGPQSGQQRVLFFLRIGQGIIQVNSEIRYMQFDLVVEYNRFVIVLLSPLSRLVFDPSSL